MPAPVNTLCMSCRKAIPQLCRWIDRGDMAGLVVETRTIKMQYGRKDKKTGKRPMMDFEKTKVVECERYEPGELPPLFGRVM